MITKAKLEKMEKHIIHKLDTILTGIDRIEKRLDKLETKPKQWKPI